MIPETGVYLKSSNLLIADLGAFSIKTITDANAFTFKGDRHEPDDARLRKVRQGMTNRNCLEIKRDQLGVSDHLVLWPHDRIYMLNYNRAWR